MNGRESHVLVFNPGSASLKFEVIEACPIEVGDVPLPRDVGVERPTLTGLPFLPRGEDPARHQ